MQVDYNKFTESELRVILEAARTINFAFGQQFPSVKEQMALLIEDFQFRAIRLSFSRTTPSAQSTSPVASTPMHRTSFPTAWRNNFSKLSASAAPFGESPIFLQ